MNYWIEIKNPNEVDKYGVPYKKKGGTYEKQKNLLEHWTGHYRICSTLDQVLSEIGIKTL